MTITGKAPQPQAGQAIFAFAGHQEAGKEINFLKHHIFAMRNALDPVLAAGRGYGRGDEAEVSAAIVGADIPQAVAMVDGVLVIVLARADQGEAVVRPVGCENA